MDDATMNAFNRAMEVEKMHALEMAELRTNAALKIMEMSIKSGAAFDINLQKSAYRHLMELFNPVQEIKVTDVGAKT